MNRTISSTVRTLPRWSRGEDAVLLQSAREVCTAPVLPVGNISRVVTVVQDKLPTRTRTAIIRRLKRLGLTTGPRTRTIQSGFKLSEIECAWLAGLLETDGSVGKPVRRIDGRTGGTNGTEVKVKPLINTDLKLVQEVQRLLPSSYVVTTSVEKRLHLPVKPTKPIYAVVLNGQRRILDYLMQVLPYMHHSDKIDRAKAMISFITGRIGGICG